MVLPGHLAGGYLATTALLSFTHVVFSPTEMGILYTVGILSGDGPDIDLFLFYLEQRSSKLKKRANHREYLTHTPILWLIGCFLISIIGYLFGSQFLTYLGLVILCGAWSHLILDSIEYGVKWLWPFSDKLFCLIKSAETNIGGQPGTFAYYWEYIRKFYIKNVTFYIEILVVIIAIYVALR